MDEKGRGSSQVWMRRAGARLKEGYRRLALARQATAAVSYFGARKWRAVRVWRAVDSDRVAQGSGKRMSIDGSARSPYVKVRAPGALREPPARRDKPSVAPRLGSTEPHNSAPACSYPVFSAPGNCTHRALSGEATALRAGGNGAGTWANAWALARQLGRVAPCPTQRSCTATMFEAPDRNGKSAS
jgi:hypothetical protein